MSRMLHVTRILVGGRALNLLLPLGILSLALLGNIVIFAAIADVAPREYRITGGLSSVYVVACILHLQTMTQFFPFAVGLSVTRRTFLGAATLMVAGQALVYGILFWLMRLVEDATDGWGLGIQFFGLPFLTMENPFLQVIVYAVPLLALSILGLWVGATFARWRQPGVVVLGVGLGALAVLFVFLATWLRWWPAVGEFFASQSPMVLLAGYPLAIAAVLAGATYLTTRRAPV